MDNLFTHMHDNLKPLAEKMRPISLDDFVGQQHILGEGKLLRRLIQAKKVPSCIFLDDSCAYHRSDDRWQLCCYECSFKRGRRYQRGD